MNTTELQKRLDAVRAGNSDSQISFLQSLDYDGKALVLNTMLGDDDLRWLKPLALDLCSPAIEMINDGMHRKARVWDEDFTDEETGETFTYQRCEEIEDETVFTTDEAFLKQVRNKFIAAMPNFDNKELEQYRWCGPEIYHNINDELDRRDPQRVYQRICENKGLLYEVGCEKCGIFVDYGKAKTYYEKAGKSDFDPIEAARRYREHATSLFPKFVTYRLSGIDANAVKTLFLDLYNKHGEHTEPFMYLPLEIVMKTLVGSSAYVGYIQSIKVKKTVSIEIEFYDCNIECLKYALLQAFPDDLEIKVIEHEP